jgi:NAD(P)-dependent dehydrogenase (short-subunit alcohol dehydrogenase family)
VLKLEGRVALITGAAGGIGRATALALGLRGAHLFLTDIDTDGLAETERLARAAAPAGTRVVSHALDVADRDAIMALPATFSAAYERLDLLINNAGVAVGGRFEEIAEQDFDWLFAINFFGVVRMTRAFLPLLRQSDDARIVNISSLFGLIATPGQTAYTASKYAVRGFSESLRHELADTKIGVTTVHPGGVATSIAKNARLPRGSDTAESERQRAAFAALLKLPPEAAAAKIVRAIERRRPRVIIGSDAKFAVGVERALPVSYWSVLRRFSSRPKRKGPNR